MSVNRQRTRARRTTSAVNQQGVALITVLLVFTIATLIAAKIILAKSLDVQRTTGMINRTQAYYYALAAEQLAILALQEDAANDQENFPQGDNLDEFWAQGPIPFEIDNIGTVLVSIVDLNRFYNLNNIILPTGETSLHELERFRDLLIELNIDETLADNLADWLDADNNEQGYQSEREDYAQEQPAYLGANRMLTDISELRLVRGFTPDVMATLLPHITVVKTPGVLPLNVNTASEYALATLQKSGIGASSGSTQGITLTGGQDIVALRSEPFDSIGQVTSRVTIPNLQTVGELNPDSGAVSTTFPIKTVSVNSEFFDIHIRADYAGSTAYLSTTVKREGIGNTASCIVLQRKETDNSAWHLAATQP